MELEEDTIEVYCVILSAIVCGLGMLFNGAFITVIIKNSPETMKAYAVLLFNFAFFDFLACFGSMLAMQRVIFAGWSIAYIFNGACQFVHPYLCYWVHCFNCHVFAHSQWILLMSFIYRYYILVQPPPERKTIVQLCLAIYSVSVIMLAPYSWYNTSVPEMTEIIRKYNPTYRLEGYAIGGNGSLFECFTAVAVLYMVVPCPFVYAVILYFRGKTLAYLNEAACSLSETTKKVHRKMIKALTIQACIPVFYLLGATQYTLGTFHFISGVVPEHGTFMSMEIMPMITPLVSLYFIHPYRRAVLKWFGFDKSDKVTPAAAATVSSTVKTSKTTENDLALMA